MNNKYDEIWDKIRSIESDEADFILACGTGDTKIKICDYFLENDVLRDYYIDEKGISLMCEKYKYTREPMYALIRSELLGAKIFLAEEGLFDDIDFGDDEIYYQYLRNKIECNGLSALFYNEEISYKDIAIAIGINANAVRMKVIGDKKRIKEALKEAGLADKGNCFKLYLYVFEGIYKDIEDIPYKYLKMVDDFIKSDSFVANRCIRNYNYSDENMNIYKRKCLELRKKVVDAIKQGNKRKKVSR